MRLPVLLKIRHFVFVQLIVTLFCLHYSDISLILLFSSSPFSQRRTMSSAQKIEFILWLSIIRPLSRAIKSFASSAIKILKRRGLSTQPCLTPWLIGNDSVILPSIFIHALSYTYRTENYFTLCTLPGKNVTYLSYSAMTSFYFKFVISLLIDIKHSQIIRKMIWP